MKVSHHRPEPGEPRSSHSAAYKWISARSFQAMHPHIGISVRRTRVARLRGHQIDQICAPHMTSALDPAVAQIGGYLKSFVDNAW
jgi:hypothetical protein